MHRERRKRRPDRAFRQRRKISIPPCRRRKKRQLKGFLDQKLDAQVLKTQEAIDEGLFGTGLEAEKFRDHAGDLTIISRGRKIHWFRPEELEDIGVHGGLHEKEMNIPLLYCELSDLQD